MKRLHEAARWMPAFAALALCLAGCAPAPGPKEASVIQATNDTAAAPPPISKASSWAYWLSSPDLAQLARSPYQIIVMDYSADGTDPRRFSRDAVDYLKDRGKIVLCYLSVGEAEEYRFYWDATWRADPPDYLGPENPEWPQAYKVRYWDPAWRERVLAPYLDRIAAAGFDGAYLDIVDGYWFWHEQGQDLRTAADRMAELIVWTAEYARSISQDRFLVCIQNGLGVFNDASPAASEQLMRTIDMAAVESLFYNIYSKEDQRYRIAILQRLAQLGKILLNVEYIAPDKRSEYLEKIEALPFPLLPYRAAPDRALDRLETDGG